MMPTQHEVETWLDQAVEQINKRDGDLLSRKGVERPLAHRLALYLEHPDWNVDCEYGKLGDKPKYLKPNASSQKHMRLVRPDVIIHIRGKGDRNLVAIELKQNPSKKDKHKDQEKLRSYKKLFQYRFAVFVENRTLSRSLTWEFV